MRWFKIDGDECRGRTINVDCIESIYVDEADGPNTKVYAVIIKLVSGEKVTVTMYYNYSGDGEVCALNKLEEIIEHINNTKKGETCIYDDDEWKKAVRGIHQRASI